MLALAYTAGPRLTTIQEAMPSHFVHCADLQAELSDAVDDRACHEEL